MGGPRAQRHRLLGLLLVAALAWPPSLRAAEPPAAPPTAPAPAAPAPTVPAAPPQAAVDAYENAVNTFKYQDFENAVSQLRALLYPSTSLDRQREWKAREYLGAALWWQGDVKSALDELTALLVRNPPFRLDPALYPPKMIADFETQRQTLIRLGVVKPDQPPPDDTPVPPEPPLALMFFPFGVGQFANREPTKGTVLLVLETALAGISAGYYLSNREAGLTTGSKPFGDEVVQIATGAAFWLLAGWGIVDAVGQHRETRRRRAAPP